MSAPETSAPDARDRRADLIGWTLMIVLGVALVGIMTYKVRHANQRYAVGQP